MEMSSAPDIRRRPHRVHWAPGGKRFGKPKAFFKTPLQKFFVLANN
jgi:hypothetical protein